MPYPSPKIYATEVLLADIRIANILSRMISMIKYICVTIKSILNNISYILLLCDSYCRHVTIGITCQSYMKLMYNGMM